MKKFLVLTLVSFLSISADHTVKRIVTFDTYNFKKTSVQCHIVGHGNFVTLAPDSDNPGKNKQVTVKREYSIQTPAKVCEIPNVKGKLTCHLSEITREVDTVKLSRLEGKGACHTQAPFAGWKLADTDGLLQEFCAEFPDAKGCK